MRACCHTVTRADARLAAETWGSLVGHGFRNTHTRARAFPRGPREDGSRMVSLNADGRRGHPGRVQRGRLVRRLLHAREGQPARLADLQTASDALFYIAPVGEKDEYVERALGRIQPFLP